jgi:hypothetical protein
VRDVVTDGCRFAAQVRHEARITVPKILANQPKLTVSRWAKGLPYRRCASLERPNEPGVSPRFLWRTRGPVNLVVGSGSEASILLNRAAVSLQKGARLAR